MPSSVDEPAGKCSLCGGAFVDARRKKLNSLPVCLDCSNGYQNRRIAAFLVDLTSLVTLANLIEPIWILNGRLNVIALAALLILILKDGLYGYSFGKWLFGLRVVEVQTHRPIGLVRSALRNLPLLIPWIGVVLIMLDLRRGRRWGDGLAGTIVIWRRYAESRAFWPPGPNCLKCQYDLTGNVSGICPECGTLVPPHLRQTSRSPEVVLDVRNVPVGGPK